MDEGPQVTDPGDVADLGARGDVSSSATQTPADSGQEVPLGTAKDAEQADDESAETGPDQAADSSDKAPAAAATEGERPGSEATAQSTPPAPEALVPPPESEIVSQPPEPEAVVPPREPAAAEPAAPEPAAPEPAAPEPAAPEPAAPEPAAAEPGAGEASASHDQAAELQAELADIGARLDEVAASAAELSRLRSRDTDLIAKLHDDVTRLRSGEIAAALNPVVSGMIKLHDQMVSLGANADPASPVGMLHTQLLQIMELTCAVRPFMPTVGEPFDASHHTGTRRRPTTDASLDGTIAAAIKAGFVRTDGSVVRVAEVEVHRLTS